MSGVIYKKVLSKSPINLFVNNAIKAICLENLSFLSTHTPKSLIIDVSSIQCDSTEYSKVALDLPNPELDIY